MSFSTRQLRLTRSLGFSRNSQPWLLQRRRFTVSAPTCSTPKDAGLKDSTELNRQDTPDAPAKTSAETREARRLQRIKHGGRNVFSPMPDGTPTRSQIEQDKVPKFTLGRAGHGAILGQSRDKPIRARFAPSPTGDLHLGSLRTALFNKLAANGTEGGTFILRIEDTDQSRLVEGAEGRLMKDLEWAGLSWDEGPERGGAFGPYRQSERLDIYKEHIQKLIAFGHAYRCFCSSELLQAQKEQMAAEGQPTNYPQTCRHVSPEESEARAAAGERHSVRFKSDAEGPPSFRDAVYGLFKKRDRDEDFVLMKSDGFPTYHFANVVDDHLMEITHVIRGEEWLISTPKHIALYRAFGWEPPTFAHIGLLVNPDGSKLSKRDNNVNLIKYQEDKTLPLAFLRWLGNLGGSFHDKVIPRTFDELTNDFTFKFTKGGIQLNMEKLERFQQRYAASLILKPRPQLAEQEEPLIEEYLVQPMVQQILHLTHNHDPSLPADSPLHAPEYSHRPLELVPVLASGSDVAQSTYLRTILNGGPKRGYERAGNLIQANPYYFWRPPMQLYANSLAAYTPDDRVLDALERILQDHSLWDPSASADERALREPRPNRQPTDLERWALYPRKPEEMPLGEKVFGALGEALKPAFVKNSLYHASLRLVATGSFTYHSQGSSRMLGVLGRDEWALRLAIVRDVINEQIATGKRPALFSLKAAQEQTSA